MVEAFIKKYPPRDPILRPTQKTPSQLEELQEIHGVYCVDNAPAVWAVLTTPPTYEKASDKKTRYLWVIIDIPPKVRCINEYDSRAITEERERVHHTNLTGGKKACAGGELWFASPSLIYLNGISGRYPVTDEVQLQEATQVFARKGYRVGSMGFSRGTGMPRKAVRTKEIEWFDPQVEEV